MKKVKLIDVCDFQGGSQPPKDEWSYEQQDGYIRMLQIRDFTQTRDFVEEYIKISASTKICEKDDILIARYGASIGKILTGLSGAYNVAIMKTIPDENILKKSYLKYYLLSDYFQNRIKNVGSRAAQAGFNKSELKELFIPLRSFEEQEKIICELDSIEKVIQYHNELIEIHDETIRSRFLEMFGDPILNDKGWKTMSFKDMGECKNGMNFCYDEQGVEIHCLGVGDFKDYSVISETDQLPQISLDAMPAEEYLLNDGDIVFVRSNGNKALVGRSVAVYPNDTPTTFSGFCIRFRNKCDKIEIPYLLRVLKTDSMRKKMAGRGANIQNLNQQILASLVIPIPPIKLQKQFVDFVEQVEKAKQVIKEQLAELETLKKSLMQKYFG